MKAISSILAFKVRHHIKGQISILKIEPPSPVHINGKQRKTPDKIGQSAHRSAKIEVRDKTKIFTGFG